MRQGWSSGTAVGAPDPKPARSALYQRRLAAGLAILLGALILWLALPRVLASAWLTMRDPVIREMDAGEPVSDAELLGLIASRELALGWVEDRETHAERGIALAELAFRADPHGAAEQPRLERAVRALRAGLADWHDLPLLEKPKQLRLDIGWEIADLVEEQGSSGCRADQPQLVGDCTGKTAAAMAK